MNREKNNRKPSTFHEEHAEVDTVHTGKENNYNNKRSNRGSV